MIFQVVIDCDNAAFADDLPGETGRILKKIADRISYGERKGNVLDINGNNAGHFTFIRPIRRQKT